MRDPAGVELDKLLVRAVQGAAASPGLEQRLHFVVSNFVPGGYKPCVRTKPKTELPMKMDLRDAPIQWGVPAERNRTIRFQDVATSQAGRSRREGGVEG
jgi:hypothetical protein